jgi:hypothetical protein
MMPLDFLSSSRFLANLVLGRFVVGILFYVCIMFARELGNIGYAESVAMIDIISNNVLSDWTEIFYCGNFTSLTRMKL